MIQVHNDEERIRARSRRRAGELRVHLRGLDGADVASALADLAMVDAGERELSGALDDRIVRIADHAQAQADRVYAMDVLRSEFAALGYEVGEEFATILIRADTMVLSGPEIAGVRGRTGRAA